MPLFKTNKKKESCYCRVNENGEWLTKEEIGFFLRSKVDFCDSAHKAILSSFIEEFLDIMKPEEPDFFRYGENANRYKLFNKTRFEEFKKHFLNFKENDETLSYEIDIKKGCGKDSTLGEFRLFIDINGLVKKFRKKGKDGGAHQIHIYIPKGIKRLKQILDFVKKYYVLLGCDYGYINPILAYNRVPLESSWVLAEYIKEEKEGIFDIPVQLDMSQFKDKVNGAQWGNFLSENHINALGGKKRIKDELKEFIVEDINSNSLFIRMPFDIPIEQDEKVVEYYRKLAKFLEQLYTKKWLFGIVLRGSEGYFRRFLWSKNERTTYLVEVDKATKYWKERLAPIMKKVKGEMKR